MAEPLTDADLVDVAHAPDAAELLGKLTAVERARLFRLIPRSQWGPLFDKVAEASLRDAVRNAPTIGAFAGGMMGGPGGAALGYAGGRWIDKVTNPDEGVQGFVPRMVDTAVGSGLNAAVTWGTGKALEGALKGSKYLMGKGLDLSDKLLAEHPDLVETMLKYRIPITRAGLEKARALLGKSGESLQSAIRAADQPPKTAGLLGPAQVPVPLGEPPVPSGGQLATPRAKVTQITPEWSATKTQGMSPDNPQIPRFGMGGRALSPRPTADVVEGPGVVMQAAPYAPGPGAPPTMVDPAAIHNRAMQLIRERAGGMTSVPDDILSSASEYGQRWLEKHAVPMTVAKTQGIKQASQVGAEGVYAAGRQGNHVTSGQKLWDWATGVATREAIEARVPIAAAGGTNPLTGATEAAGQNAISQSLIGAVKGIEGARPSGLNPHTARLLAREAIGMAVGGAAGGASHRSNMGAATGAAIGAALASPAGLSHAALLLDLPALKNPAVQQFLLNVPRAAAASLIQGMLDQRETHDAAR